VELRITWFDLTPGNDSEIVTFGIWPENFAPDCSGGQQERILANARSKSRRALCGSHHPPK
jgi:hypothetical protein